jgi:hypothetical protein
MFKHLEQPFFHLRYFAKKWNEFFLNEVNLKVFNSEMWGKKKNYQNFTFDIKCVTKNIEG